MSKLFTFSLPLLLLSALLSLPLSASAQSKGDEAAALALVKKAVEYVKTNGRESSLKEFSKPQGSFSDRDLYIFAIDLQGKMVAHGAIKNIIDKNVLEMKDADGKFLFKTMLEMAATKGSGWLQYKWPNPLTKSVDAKSTYIEKYGELIIGCGVYK
ncbi:MULTISPECIES: cache domain-containing protein [unclassified Undibacterium]|uniref:cache domain-containing protein n=1 Tax=unclassified Undibacterium TaxID=2630295 RepID=UPI002AC8EE9F|nr:MULTISPECIES: cache domain-containing protein [unclassified Undibacterium]MEB0140582.1 cache domain-containing protein [Undibacterium sp. CCC2.1]MEB0173636.1 cache domain-containing protein [Undibacterium sp. CCC1.1]MEB0177348.1 cache domain-containing protein [Undibacterium sp. CCC3.4]MEB0216759.1 cache domain-containing protein [Undibacterium sp. 5I2]WPX44561.1 cache domain-containing protein [Undibacterium sp. CCC3.4]